MGVTWKSTGIGRYLSAAEIE